MFIMQQTGEVQVKQFFPIHHRIKQPSNGNVFLFPGALLPAAGGRRVPSQPGAAFGRDKRHIFGNVHKQDLAVGANLFQRAQAVAFPKRHIHHQSQLVRIVLIPAQGTAAALCRPDTTCGRIVYADFYFFIGITFGNAVDLYQYREFAGIKLGQRLFAGVGMIGAGNLITGGLVKHFCQFIGFVLVRGIDNHHFALYRADVRVFTGQVKIRQLFTDAV